MTIEVSPIDRPVDLMHMGYQPDLQWWLIRISDTFHEVVDGNRSGQRWDGFEAEVVAVEVESGPADLYGPSEEHLAKVPATIAFEANGQTVWVTPVLLRAWRKGSDVHGEKRWDPERRASVSYHGLDPQDGKTQTKLKVAEAWEALRIGNDRLRRAGRPPSPLPLEQVLEICRDFRERHGYPITQEHLADVMCARHGVCVTLRQFKAKLKDLTRISGMSWDQMRRP